MRTQRRYPGTPPFEQKDANIFFGRDKDIKGLLRLIRLKELVVLYAKSGLGKTSLINAGVIPALNAINREVAEEMEGISYASMRIRFFAWKDDNSQAPLHTLSKETVGQATLNPLFDKANLGLDDLWLSFKNHQLNSSTPATYVLFFDQFEELFTYPDEQIRDLKKALTTLLQTRVPADYKQHLREQFKAHPGTFSKEEKKQLLQPIHVKIVLGIRSDRLSLLHQLSDYLPNVLVNLYELKALNSMQARAAIALPAQQQGDFNSPQFTYSEAALNEILTHLEGEGTYVEPFQIQYICEHAEKVIAQSQKTVLEKGDLGDLDELFENYYHLKIAEISSEADRERARNLLEDGLLFNGVRLSLLKEQITSSRGFDISPPLLHQLENVRLVRAEGRGEQIYYEITHDTLVEPIAKAKEERKAKEQRRKMLLFGGLGIASFLIVLAGFVAVSNLYYDSREMASKYLTSEAKKTFDRDDTRLTLHLLTEALDYYEGNTVAQVLLDSLPLYLAASYPNYIHDDNMGIGMDGTMVANPLNKSLSPDGTYYVYQTNQNISSSTADLHVMNLQTKEYRNFPNIYLIYQFTQNSQYLIFQTDLVGDSSATMHLLNLETLKEDKVIKNVDYNEGFSDASKHSLVYFKNTSENSNKTMCVLNLSTLEEQNFANPDVQYQYSQDNKYLLFHTEKSENSRSTLHLLDLTSLEDLTFSDLNIDDQSPYDYNSTNQQLIFFTKKDNQKALHIFNTTNSKEKIFSNSDNRFHNLDAKSLVFYTDVVGNTKGHLHFLNLTDLTEQVITNANYYTDGSAYKYEPKQHHLTFFTDSSGVKNMHFLDLMSSQERTFFNIEAEGYELDDKHLIFVSQKDKVKKVHVIDLKNMKEKFSSVISSSFKYSSDSQHIAFFTADTDDSDRNNRTLHLLNLATLKESTFSNSYEDSYDYKFSPDGQYFTFFTEHQLNNKGTLNILHVEKSELQSIPDVTSSVENIFSPNSKYFVFLKNDKGFSATLCVLNLESMKEQDFPNAYTYHYQFSSDSQKLKFLDSEVLGLHVIDLKTMNTIRTLYHQTTIKHSEFLEDGRHIMSWSKYLGAKNGVLKITDLHIEGDLIEYYNGFYAPLTDEEEENYSLD